MSTGRAGIDWAQHYVSPSRSLGCLPRLLILSMSSFESILGRLRVMEHFLTSFSTPVDLSDANTWRSALIAILRFNFFTASGMSVTALRFEVRDRYRHTLGEMGNVTVAVGCPKPPPNATPFPVLNLTTTGESQVMKVRFGGAVHRHQCIFLSSSSTQSAC